MKTPYERVRQAGTNSASVTDMLSVAFARRESDVTEATGLALLNAVHGKVQRLSDLPASVITEITGFEDFETLRCQVLIELGRRSAKAGEGSRIGFDQPDTVATYLDYLRGEKQEHFVILLLNAKNELIRDKTVHKGGLTMSIVELRTVFREALLDAANAIIVAHNHPSGDPTPSPEDVAVTRKLVEAGRLLDVEVLDHLIIGAKNHPNGPKGYVSLRDRGLM